MIKRNATLSVAASLALVSVLAACGSTTTASAGTHSSSGGTAASSTTGTGSSAATWKPTRPITIITGFTAGSAVDVEARTVAKELEQIYHWSVVVQDVPGASENLAVNALESKPANGYTLLLTTRTFAFDLAAPKPTYTLSQFAPITQLDAQAGALVVPASSPYKTLAQFVAAAKAHPGQLTIAGPGTVAIEPSFEYEFTKAAGINVKWVPYNGGSKVVAAVLGGHADAAMAGSSNFLPNVKAGKLRYLALSAKQPYSPMPKAPTFAQYGYPINELVWYGMVAKAGTPQNIINTVNAALQNVAKTAAWKQFETTHATESSIMGPKQFGTFLQAQVSKTKGIVATLTKLYQKG